MAAVTRRTQLPTAKNVTLEPEPLPSSVHTLVVVELMLMDDVRVDDAVTVYLLGVRTVARDPVGMAEPKETECDPLPMAKGPIILSAAAAQSWLPSWEHTMRHDCALRKDTVEPDVLPDREHAVGVVVLSSGVRPRLLVHVIGTGEPPTTGDEMGAVSVSVCDPPTMVKDSESETSK